MKLKTSLITAMLLAGVWASAEDSDEKLLNLQLMARFDYQRDYVRGEANSAGCGFRGKNVSVYLDGDIGGQFSYAYRQRLNRAHKSEGFFDATDFLYLTYEPDGNWKFSAGKQIVAIGGHEYDLAPIDSYFVSEYSNSISCYQPGVSVAGYLGHDKTDLLEFQFCQSPCRESDISMDIYSYNLMWSGEHGVFRPLWSLNFMEYEKGEFLNCLAFGNYFELGRTAFFVDLMNRSPLKDFRLFRDFTVVGKFTLDIGERLRIFAKASHDYNGTESMADWTVLPGTSITRVGGGMEFFPLRNSRNLRIHAAGCRTFGRNGNPDGTLEDMQTFLNMGVSWRMNLLSFRKK